MPLNWTTGDLMVPAGCLPCCIQNIPTPPTENYCQCLFYFPFSATIFANYNVASAAISTQTNNCIAYVTPSQNVFVATQAAAALNVSSNTSAGYQHIWASITVGTNVALNIAFNSNAVAGNNLTSITTALNVYYCNGASFSSNTNTGAAGVAARGYFLPPVITSAAQYYLEFYTLGFTGSTAVNSVWALSSNQNIVVNPAVALWDDSGTTRNLWACPKLLLPPLTENSGTWYASCSAANTDLTDALKVSNCVGYYEETGSSPLLTSFTTTDGGTSLSFSGSYSASSSVFGYLWGGINAVGGQTISIAFTGGHHISADIYDDTGVSVESLGPSTSTLTSSALPYTGRYTVRIFVNDTPFDPGFTSASATITSSGTMSVNPVSAAWDSGLTCPSYLNCGDSCP